MNAPPSALWEIIQHLSLSEYRQIKRQINRGRLHWLLETLRQMREYDAEKLTKAFRRRFPKANAEALRVYKHRLFKEIYTSLLSNDLPLLREQVELWKGFWLSFWAWEKGLSQLAEVFWYDTTYKSIKQGRYEIALWGLSLLELYFRDFHRAASSSSISEWSRQLRALIDQRYEALNEKITASEQYTLSRSPQGWRLPNLPSTDVAASYMLALAGFIRSYSEDNYVQALTHLLDALELFERETPLPTPHPLFHKLVVYANLGTILLHLHQWDAYERWYKRWEALRDIAFSYPSLRLERFHRFVLASKILYLVIRGLWSQAYSFWYDQRSVLESFLRDTSMSLLHRLVSACHVYLVLLLVPQGQVYASSWRDLVEYQMKKEEVCQDQPYLFWLFLQWYEAYRRKDLRAMRRSHRRLTRSWKTHFAQHTPWYPVLRLLYRLSQPLPLYLARHILRLRRRWNERPAEADFWENHRVIFPMEAFIESLERRVPLEFMQLSSSSGTPFPEELRERVNKFLGN